MQKIEFAVKGLVIYDNKFLAVHKSNIKSPKYELPGGKMSFGETAEDTLKRELMEEVGVQVIPLKIIDTWNYLTKANQVTGIIYLCAANNPGSVVLSSEHDDYEWLSVDVDSFEKMNRLFQPQMLRWNWNELINIQRNNDKLTIWNEIKQMISESVHENDLLTDDIFTRNNYNRGLLDFLNDGFTDEGVTS